MPTTRTSARGLSVLVAAVALVLAGCSGHQVRGSVATDPAPTEHASPSAPAAPASSPPGQPRRLTLAEFEHNNQGQDYRPYTGPTPPAFSSEQALQMFRDPHAYVIGLVDVGLVNTRTGVHWTHDWIVGDVVHVANIYASYRGPGPTPTPKPGWIKVDGVYDSDTGAWFSSGSW